MTNCVNEFNNILDYTPNKLKENIILWVESYYGHK